MERLLVAERRFITSACRKACANIDDADDLYGDAVLRCLEFAHLYDNTRPFRPWICTVISRLSKDNWRRMAKMVFVPEVYTAPLAFVSDTPLEGISSTMERQSLENINRQDISDRILMLLLRRSYLECECFVLRYVHDLSHEEISARLHINRIAVRTYISTALRYLRKALCGETNG